jgi:protein phosphatase-4 regulatory subunit 3
MENTRRRVKVYELDNDSKWMDKGTGHVTCGYVENKGAVCLIVTSEEDNSVLLESKILPSGYQKQQDTLVVWSEPDNGDLALSFQEPEGCTEIWDQILTIQKDLPPSLSTATTEQDLSQALESDSESGEPEDSQRLPPANISNVGHILDTIMSADTLMKRERFVKAVMDEDYIRKLVELFTLCEDLGDRTVLYTMFNIFKQLVLMNDTNLMEVLFSDEYMIPMMGALEHDPEVQPNHQTRHREFLTRNVIFKEVVPFNSPELVERIHQTFRMQYLKDVVLNRVLDDATFATLNSLIFFNNLEIVSQLQSDAKFITELFKKLKSPETTTQQRKDLLLFLQELCNLAKNLQMNPRTAFHKTLTDQGLFDVFNTSLNDEDTAIRMASTDIMLISMAHDPSLLRGYVARQKPDHQLLRHIVQHFTDDQELGVKSQCSEILKLLIEEGLVEEPTIKDEFLNVFYQHVIPLLMAPLKLKNLKPSVAGDLSSGFVQNSICEMLCYCIRHHGYRIKYFLLGNNVPKRVLKLVGQKDTYLVLSAIRFLRAFIGAKDDFYNRHVIKEELLDPVVKLFIKNGPKYNLLNSAILELFDFVRRENINMLVQYIGDAYPELLHSVNYVDVFKNLLIKYEQLKEGPARVESSVSNGPRKTLRQLEEEEDDAYFRESDDEDESSDRKPARTSLVDYEDDDDVVTTPKNDAEGDKASTSQEVGGEEKADGEGKRKESPTPPEDDEPSPKKTRKTNIIEEHTDNTQNLPPERLETS